MRDGRRRGGEEREKGKCETGEVAKGENGEDEEREGGDVRAILITNDLPQSPYTCSRECWRERDFGQWLLSLQSLTGELESSQ